MIIGFYLASGDPEAGDSVLPYLWKAHSLQEALEQVVGNNYGPGLNLVLFQFYVEGRFGLKLPERIQVGRYSPKEKAIAVAVPLRRSDFHDQPEQGRREFLASAVSVGIEGVEKRLRRRFPDFDFPRLQQDVAKGLTLFRVSQV